MSKNLWPVFVKTAIGLAAILALVFLSGIVAGYLGAKGVVAEDSVTVWIVGVFAIVIMAGSMWGGVAWMRSIDEAAREAHKSAWYWGGTGGMAVAGFGVILASLPQASSVALVGINGRTDPAAYMAAGAIGLLTLMMVGYVVVWAWWWLVRR